MPKPIIVGIDPGTTSAYAILDIDGKLVKIHSAKEIGINDIIKQISRYGIPIIVGTDKKKTPDFIERFASKTGARVCSPESDMLALEKKKLTESFSYTDTHQMDALAASIVSLKSIQTLLNKIDKYVRTNSSEKIRDELIRFVIREEVPIKLAVNLLASPDIETKQVKKVIESRVLSKNDYVRLFSKYESATTDNKLLRKYNASLRKENADLLKQIMKLRKKKTGDNIEGLFKVKEERLRLYENKLKEKDQLVEELKEEIDESKKFLLLSVGKILFKKIRNLSKLNGVKKGDNLFVDDPNLYTKDTRKWINENINAIIYKIRVNKKTRSDFTIPLIDYDELILVHYSEFALVKKKDLSSKVDKKEIFNKIITDYKERRN